MYKKLGVSLLLLLHIASSYDLLPPPITDYKHKLRESKYAIVGEKIKALKLGAKDLKAVINFGIKDVEYLRRLEDNLIRSNIRADENVTDHWRSSDGNTEKQTLILQKAASQLIFNQCRKSQITPRKCAMLISGYSVDHYIPCTLFKDNCLNSTLFRSISGKCNHLKDPSLGKSMSPYKRYLFPDYQDGVSRPRQRDKLPKARLVTSKLIQVEHSSSNEEDFTLAVMQWGQFIEHDMTQTMPSTMIHTGNSIRCCTSDGLKLAPRYIHPLCDVISVPHDDRLYSKYGITCMNYVRSMGKIRDDCNLGPVEQINQATHFLDGSQIYGSDQRTLSKLKSGKDGLMKTYKGKFLPLNTQLGENDCIQGVCFKAGDSRVNSQPFLTAMHTLWIREHNRIATFLARINPLWTDDDIFEESRKLVIAQLQHITYSEWMPMILGPQEMDRILSKPTTFGSVDPSVSNSFATAAMKFVNSLIPYNLGMFDESRNLVKNMSLGFSTQVLLNEEVFDSLLRGLATQKSSKMDLSYARDIIDPVKEFPNGVDVVSTDIQRGRDHGLPSYNEFRRICGIREARKFEDFGDFIPMKVVKLLREIYKSPQDVDVVIGGMAEVPQNNRNIVGPTFTCLLTDQFERTRKGDTYFYSSQNGQFTPQQLAEIRKVTLAKVFCNNGDSIENMQSNAFLPISSSNNLLPCQKLPDLNLHLWKV